MKSEDELNEGNEIRETIFEEVKEDKETKKENLNSQLKHAFDIDESFGDQLPKEIEDEIREIM